MISEAFYIVHVNAVLFNMRLSLDSFQIPLPGRPHWYLLFGATEEEIKDICITTLKLYTRKKVRPAA